MLNFRWTVSSAQNIGLVLLFMTQSLIGCSFPLPWSDKVHGAGSSASRLLGCSQLGRFVELEFVAHNVCIHNTSSMIGFMSCSFANDGIYEYVQTLMTCYDRSPQHIL